jgi:hypothetical protein
LNTIVPTLHITPSFLSLTTAPSSTMTELHPNTHWGLSTLEPPCLTPLPYPIPPLCPFLQFQPFQYLSIHLYPNNHYTLNLHGL